MNNEESRFHDLLNEPPFDELCRKEHRDQLRQQMLETFDAAQAERSRRPVGHSFLYWREMMSRPAPRFAAAALVMATVCAVVIVMLQTQPTVAFASLVEPILKAKTAKFNTVVEGKDLPKHAVRTLVLEPNRLRQEMPTGQIYISDFTAGRMLILTPAEKSATFFKLTDVPAQHKPANFFDHLKTTLRAADGGSSVVREPLGRKQIAGREAVGFRLKQANAKMAIWGDAKTGLPIVVEMQLALLPGTKITLTDFEFDVKLDEALFQTEAPDGYNVETFNVAPPPEKALIAALKLLTDHNEGRFPDTFDRGAIVACMVKWVHKNPGEPDAAWKKKVMDLSLSLNGGLMFAATLPVESNARYAGKGVKYNDATDAVFWYKVAAASHYRVIYGDLSVKEQKAAPESRTGVPVKMGNPGKDWMLEMMKKKPAARLPVAPAIAPPKDLPPIAPPPKDLPLVAPLAPANQSRLDLGQDQSALLMDYFSCRLELLARRTTNPMLGGEQASRCSFAPASRANIISRV